MKFAMEQTPDWAWPRVLGVNVLGVIAGWRINESGAYAALNGHFPRPSIIVRPCSGISAARPTVGDEPLAWWAVTSVTKFSGRINLWLAGGFAVLYAAYTVWRDVWPGWLGRQVFVVFDNMGGIPALSTGLVILAAGAGGVSVRALGQQRSRPLPSPRIAAAHQP